MKEITLVRSKAQMFGDCLVRGAAYAAMGASFIVDLAVHSWWILFPIVMFFVILFSNFMVTNATNKCFKSSEVLNKANDNLIDALKDEIDAKNKYIDVLEKIVDVQKQQIALNESEEA